MLTAVTGINWGDEGKGRGIGAGQFISTGAEREKFVMKGEWL